jgi:hypothetical protein
VSFKEHIREGHTLDKIVIKQGTPTDSMHPEASYKYGTITLYPKYSKLPKPQRTHVIYHELGHWFRDEFVPLNEIMGWEEGENFFIYSMPNSDEGFAEAFAIYFTDPNDLKKKYPEQFARLKKYIGSKGRSIDKKAKDIINIGN